MSKETNFGYLGSLFQQTLLKTIIEDRKYGETIIEVLDSKYFDNNSFKFIMENIKELYTLYNKVPGYEMIINRIMAESGNPDYAKVHIDSIDGIRETKNDNEYVKDKALNFCKQQHLRRTIKTVNDIIENGDFEEYEKIEELIQKSLQVGSSSDEVEDIFDNIEDVLEKDFRHPIPLGVNGLDSLLNGGLGYGELGVVLAPTGTGKTTLLTKFANTAYNHGYHVLQIFFEDNLINIKRKHYTIWTELSIDDQIKNREATLEMVREANDRSAGSLKLLKLPNGETTVGDIKSYVRKLNSEGKKIDVLIIDYIDCLTTDKSVTGEEWKSDGAIIRGLEGMCSEFNMAVWTATQGNRGSISSEVVTADQMGGSIKKAQSAHVVISVGKTLEQKENNLGTLTLIKSRIGRDGVVFNNCKFDNEFLVIDTEQTNTLLGFQQNEVQRKQNRAAELFKLKQEREGKGMKSSD